MTYEIKNLDSLESSVKELIKINERVANNAQEIKTIIEQIKSNWENDMGNDFASIVQEMQNCVNQLDTSITGSVREYVEVIKKLAEETRLTQNSTL